MTPQEMSDLHRRAFVLDRGWSPEEFDTLLKSAYVRTITEPHGFALTRDVAGEVELLTLAVDPAFHRRGIARTLMSVWLGTVTREAETAFLEVASDNHAARALYAQFGFEEIARRAGYYARKTLPHADALILRRALHGGQSPDLTPIPSESG